MPEVDLHSTDDAQEWAKKFIDLVNDGLDIDEGLMVGWFANMAEVAKNRLTVKQLIDLAIGRVQAQRIIHEYESRPDNGFREFALAITKLEEAQMWFTRGMAIATDRFNPADLERADD